MEERRRNNRRELSSKLIMKRIGEEEFDDILEINIVDVSKTGLGFTCSEKLEEGTVYEAHLRIWTQEVIHAFLEIVRIVKKEDGYFCGCIFIGMPEADAARIAVYDMVETLKNQ